MHQPTYGAPRQTVIPDRVGHDNEAKVIFAGYLEHTSLGVDPPPEKITGRESVGALIAHHGATALKGLEEFRAQVARIEEDKSLSLDGKTKQAEALAVSRMAHLEHSREAMQALIDGQVAELEKRLAPPEASDDPRVIQQEAEVRAALLKMDELGRAEALHKAAKAGDELVWRAVQNWPSIHGELASEETLSLIEEKYRQRRDPEAVEELAKWTKTSARARTGFKAAEHVIAERVTRSQGWDHEQAVERKLAVLKQPKKTA